MTRRATFLRLALAALVLLPGLAAAQVMYAASLRSFANAGGQIVVGNLFTINLGDGATKLLAPIRLDNGTAVGITGLAVHPTDGAFYAITSGLSPDHPHSLVQIDPKTGNAKLIGALKARGSDIAFGPGGTLYIWIPGSRQLGTVQLSGAPYTSINAMTFTPSGLLLAVNSNAGSPALTRLVQINTSTGQVAALVPLPDDTDAISFGPPHSLDIAAMLETMGGRMLAVIALAVGSVLALLGVGIFSWRKRRHAAKP